MMKPRLIPWILVLVVALLAVACAPAASTESAPPEVSAPAAQMAATATPAPTDAPAALTEVPAVLPVATSRGPNLEATDPATVNLASGGLQLVEFFRFT